MNEGQRIEQKMFEVRREIVRREKAEKTLEEVRRLLGIGDTKAAYELTKERKPSCLPRKTESHF